MPQHLLAENSVTSSLLPPVRGLQVEHLGAKLWLAPFFAEPSRQTPHFFTPLSASPFTISHWAGPYEYYL